MVSRLVLGTVLSVASIGAHADLILSAPLSTTNLATTPQFSRPGVPSLLAQVVDTGSVLSTNGAGTVTFTYIGSEAGFVNQFFTNGTEAGSAAFSTPGSTNMMFVPCSANCTTGPIPVSVGTLAFSFRSPIGATANGVDGMMEPDFAVWLQDPNTAYLFFNDGGGGDDFDFNDMIIKASFAAIPEPHTIALVFAGLGILGIMARRRTRK
jgi:hypothetical protein